MTSTDNSALIAKLQSLDSASFSNDDDRVLTLRAAQALCNRLETPYEAIMRLTYQEPPYRFALQMADKMSVFKTLAASDKAISTDELAAVAHAKPDFLKRILRHLAAKGTIIQHAADSWGSTRLSRAFADPAGSANINAMTRRAETVYGAGLAFFENHGLENPSSGLDTMYQQAYDCPGVGMFEHMKRPENAAMWQYFNTTIGWNTQYRVSWMDILQPESLFRGLDNPEAVAIVDIGGGTGADVAEVRRRYPKSTMPARVVLQEQVQVIESATAKNQSGEVAGSLDEVELQVHDFWTAQPLQGARVYYLSSVLHDWPDKESQDILKQIVKVMKSGYSKLVINENVVPEVGCLPQLSGLDLAMMANLAAKERTETDWQKLLKPLGLKFRVHTIPSCTKAVIEAELES